MQKPKCTVTNGQYNDVHKQWHKREQPLTNFEATMTIH